MSNPLLARRERHDLCDLALTLGPDVPTRCGDWTCLDLVAHLLVRERRPLAAAGILVPALSRLTDQVMARTVRTDFAVLVERLRDPGVLTPFALRPVEHLVNTLEFFVHHEDVRRAQPGWVPRRLRAVDEDVLWSGLDRMGSMLARPAGVPLVVVRDDPERTGGPALSLRKGDDPVSITGRPSELVLLLFGREARDLELTGPADGVARLRSADLGL